MYWLSLNQVEWMDGQNHEELTRNLKDPTSKAGRQMSRIKYNAGQVLQRFAQEWVGLAS